MNHKTSKHLKKLFLLLFITMFLLVPISYADTQNNDYTIPLAIKFVNVTDDTSIIVEEQINYTFNDTSTDISKIITLKDNQEIDNISIETPDLYNKMEIINTSEGVNIKITLYKDAQMTQKVTDGNAKIIYHYTLLKGVNIYDDVAELNYNSWSENENGVDKLQTFIYLPDTYKNVEEWNNPPYLVSSASYTLYNGLETVFKTIDNGENVEQRLLIPKEYFNSTDNANIIHENAKEKIEQQQEEYMTTINNNYTITYILIILSIILILSPLVMYYGYIRDHKTEENLAYAKDIPTDDNLLFVNSMFSGNVNEIDFNGFFATLLDLINKKHIMIAGYEKEDIILKINNKENLKEHELIILNQLEEYSDENKKICLSIVSKNKSSFNKFFNKWLETAYSTINQSKLNSFIDKRAIKYYKCYSIITLIYLIISITCILLLTPSVPTVDLAFKTTIVLIPIIILSFAISKTFKGRLTREALKFQDKWGQFERYITDYNLIKENPPESIEVCNKYLIYATTMGDIILVNKNISHYFKYIKVSDDVINNSDLFKLSFKDKLISLYSILYELTIDETK